MDYKLDVDVFDRFDTIEDEKIAELKNKLNEIFETFDIKLGDIRLSVCPEFNGDYSVNILSSNDNYEMTVLKTGEILFVDKIKSVNTDEIKKECVLKKYPIVLNDYVLNYNEEKIMCCNCEPVKIVNLWVGEHNKSHDPLIYYEFTTASGEIDNSEENWCRAPEYDTDDMLAFICNKYAWGMNLSVCMYDYKNNTIYLMGAYNFDYPEGIALKYEDNKTYIYLSSGDGDRTMLYRKENIESDEMRLNLLDMYRNTNWNLFDDGEIFNSVLELSKLYKKFNHIKDFSLMSLTTYTGQLIENGEYDECIMFINTMLEYEVLCKMTYQRHAIGYILKYNLACCFSLKDETEKALTLLKDLYENEGLDLNTVFYDNDFIKVRNTKEFKDFFENAGE